MGARSYVPQVGRFLQPDPIPGGSADAYSYTFGDPVNSSDPTGAYVEGDIFSGYTSTQNRLAVEAENVRIAAREAAEREASARAAAERAAREAAAAAALAGPQYAGGEEWGEEWEEWWEEEGGYEWASYHHGTKPASEEHHIEPAILVQPLNSKESGATGEDKGISPLCDQSSLAEGCTVFARGGEGTHRSRGMGPRFSHVPSGNICYGISAVTTIAGPELSVPRLVGYALFGLCGG